MIKAYMAICCRIQDVAFWFDSFTGTTTAGDWITEILTHITPNDY